MDKKPLPSGFQSRELQPVELPNPSSFRQLRPAILGTPPVSVKTRLFERRRVIIGLGIAAAFHVSLGLAWWLTPPLRLKAGIDPKRWVQVVSVPQQEPQQEVSTLQQKARPPQPPAAAKPHQRRATIPLQQAPPIPVAQP